ncbi:MAG TPA: cytochrome c [Candidatus Eisenbacteria bacterium]
MASRRRSAILVALAAATAGGCGWFQSPKTTAPTPEAVVSVYDRGPRAGEAPYMPVWAIRGESLFVQKGCKACHAYGARLTGPDLRGVTRRRSAEWMEQQILHPDVMTKEDPISMALFAEYVAQMANQGLTPDEAKDVIEYLKKLDDGTEEREGPQAFQTQSPPPFAVPDSSAPPATSSPPPS